MGAEPRGQSPVERILLHIVQVITVTGIIGGYAAITGLQTDTAVLGTKLESMSERLDDFRVVVGDRYTATQAIRDIKPLVDRVSDHEARLRQLEHLNNGKN